MSSKNAMMSLLLRNYGVINRVHEMHWTLLPILSGLFD